MTNSELQTSNDPEISIIVPHYNDLGNLRHCLEALKRQTLPRSRFEIVVADNNSVCGIKAVIDLCGPDVTVVPAPVQGAAAARNAAPELTRGAVYAFIDSDCRPAQNWLEEGLKALENSDSSADGSMSISPTRRGRPPSRRSKRFSPSISSDISKRKVLPALAIVRAPRDLSNASALFRNGLSEDKDWSRRAMAIGLKITYCGNVVVCHPARRSWEELAKKTRRVVRETVELKRAEKTAPAPGGFISSKSWLLPSFTLSRSSFQE